jgi:hypothetical protein
MTVVLRARRIFLSPSFGFMVFLLLFWGESAFAQPASASLETLGLQCHYLQGMKYADEQDAAQASAWMTELATKALAGKNTGYDLFSRNGGGPYGSEWNSNGALVVVALVPIAVSDIGKAELRLNGHRWERVWAVLDGNGRIAMAVEVPGEAWERRLKRMGNRDFGLVFPENAKEECLEPLKKVFSESRLLEVEFRMKTQSGRKMAARNAFAVSYGE